MTTFQEPPPQSRRAVRQSERGETPQQTPAATPAEEQPAGYTFDPASGTATGAPDPAAQQPQQPVSGRRAQQGRVPAPADAQNAQPLASSPPPGMSGETPEQAAYRVRDFSPESRRSADPSPMAGFDAPASPLPFDALFPTQGGAHSAGGSSLTLDDTLNHTLSRRELREMRAAAEAQAPELQVPEERPEPIDALLNSGPIDIPTLAPPPGQSQALAEAMAEFDLLTRSRREAEARARDAQVASLATPIIPQAQGAPAEAPAQAAHHAAHSAQSDAVTDAAAAQAQQLPFQQESTPEPPVVPMQYSVPSAPQAVVSTPSAPPPVQQPPMQPVPVQQVSVPQPPVQMEPGAQEIAYPPTASLPTTPPTVASPPQVAGPAPMLAPPMFDAPPTAPAPSLAAPPPTSSAPTAEQDPHGGRSPRASGHWRVQAEQEDDGIPYENTLSRTVGPGTSAITTSALVLPSVPQPDLILNSLTSTGEIIVTGTIDLPRSLGSTGAHPSRVDNSDFEDDPLDSQVAAPDSAPIRAIRAISTNTSTRGVIEAKRPQGNRMLTAVIIVASVLCVGLVGLLVFAIATNKL